MRNLGWLLLAGFFGFMLFLISSNNDKNLILTGSGETQSGKSATEDFSDLVDKLDNPSNTPLSGSVSAIQSPNSESGNFDDTEKQMNKLSFFEKIFGKKDVPVPKIPHKEIISTGSITKPAAPVDIETQKLLQKNESSSGIFINYDSSTHLLKDAINTDKKPVSPSTNFGKAIPDQQKTPGVISQSPIGTRYVVAVQSLKLNNKIFTQTLGYLKFNDQLEQISEQNNAGCFEVVVLQAQNRNNIGKRGYVCTKYLSLQNEIIPKISSSDIPQNGDVNTQNNPSISQNAPHVFDSSLYPNTQIGDIITLKRSTQVVLKEYTDLAAGDQIDQMTNIDTYGCIIAHVYSSILESSRDMVGKICLKDIY